MDCLQVYAMGKGADTAQLEREMMDACHPLLQSWAAALVADQGGNVAETTAGLEQTAPVLAHEAATGPRLPAPPLAATSRGPSVHHRVCMKGKACGGSCIPVADFCRASSAGIVP